MDTERELVDIGTLATKIEDSDLRVGHTTVEARLGVWLLSSVLIVRSLQKATYLVLAVAVASCGSSGHLDGFSEESMGSEGD